MTIFPEFEQQLRQLSNQQTAASPVGRARRRPGRRSWRGQPAGVIPIVASVAVVIAVIAAVIGFGGHHAQPPSNPPPAGPVSRADHRAEMRYAELAQRRADRLAVCQTQPASSLNGAPPRSLTANIAAIRQPGPALALPGLLARNVRHLYVHHSRVALRQDGNEYWIVTVAESGSGPLSTPACREATFRAFNRELPQIPTRLRASTRQVLRIQLSVEAESFSPSVCLLVQYPAADATTCSANAHQLNNYGLVTYYGQLNGVVPDGVASVTIRYHNPKTNASKTTTAHVTNNVFATTIPPEISPGRQPTSTNPIIIWKAADGRTLKTINSGRSVSDGTCGGRATHIASTTSTDPCRSG